MNDEINTTLRDILNQMRITNMLRIERLRIDSRFYTYNRDKLTEVLNNIEKDI